MKLSLSFRQNILQFSNDFANKKMIPHISWEMPAFSQGCNVQLSPVKDSAGCKFGRNTKIFWYGTLHELWSGECQKLHPILNELHFLN